MKGHDIDWAFLAALVVYNWTEAAFKTINPSGLSFISLLWTTRDFPHTAESSSRSMSAEENREFAHAEAPKATYKVRSAYTGMRFTALASSLSLSISRSWRGAGDNN